MHIVGAGAGIGVAAVQIAKLKGARVLASTTSKEKAERLKYLGADEVFLDDGKADRLQWVMNHTAGQGAHVVFEHVGPAARGKQA